MRHPDQTPTEPKAAANTLAAKAGLGEPTGLEPIEDGHNNQVYEVQVGDGKVTLKRYFQSGTDDRDRLSTEYEFSSLLWSQGIQRIPEPLAVDRERRAALYEFVDGQPIRPEEIRKPHVDQALSFIEQVNELRNAPRARGLPLASEACITLLDHILTVQRRLDELIDVQPRDDIDEAMHTFLDDALMPRFEVAREHVIEWAEHVELDPEDPLPAHERILSPSDFGFHNALEDPEGRIRFLDFEYAGWDDPAKLVCDFVTQLTHPLPSETIPECIESFARFVPEEDGFSARARHLLPVHRLKWCLIALNEFIPTDAERRRFARQESADPTRRRIQLGKAKDAYHATDWTVLFAIAEE